MGTPPFDHLFKFILVGNSGVGKTSLSALLTKDTFAEACPASIGVDFQTHTLQLNGKSIKLHVWDTGGRERFRAITRAYYSTADGVVLVYDVTDRNSFLSIGAWSEQLNQEIRSNAKQLPVGNKCDMSTMRGVAFDEACALASSLGWAFMETSAKSANKGQEVFASNGGRERPPSFKRATGSVSPPNRASSAGGWSASSTAPGTKLFPWRSTGGRPDRMAPPSSTATSSAGAPAVGTHCQNDRNPRDAARIMCLSLELPTCKRFPGGPK